MNSKASRRPLPIAVAQSLVRWFFRFSMIIGVNVRVHRLENFPEVPPSGGPLLVCANHQSNLDPMLMGVVCPFPINYLAKNALFKFGPLRWFLTWNDSIPLDRASGIAGIKETLKRLKRGESILIFPEGSRSPDGQLQPIKQGFCTLARRTRCPILTAGISGSRAAWPPGKGPGFGNVHVEIGEVISFETYQNWSDEELAAEVGKRIAALIEAAQDRRNKQH
jgi:1-acyl-sn-glycerol-3-phosphate acyltransferase